MATPSDQLPPWETAPAQTQGEVPPWEVQEQVPTPAPTPDKLGDLDRTGSFLGTLWNDVKQAPIITPKGNLRVTSEVGKGVSDVLFATAKAPGQAMEALLGLTGAPRAVFEGMPSINTMFGVTDAISQLQKEFFDTSSAEPIPFTDQVLRGAGSALAFMTPGAALQSLGMSPALVTGALGGATGASMQYDEAVAQGATPEQAAIAYAGGAAFGLTEAVPGAMFINQLNKLTRGQLLERIKNYGLSGESNAVLNAVKGALTEATQEGIQTVGSNWVAQDLSGYDPTRTLGENFWSSVATGGIIGSLVGGGLGMIRSAERNKVLKQLEDEYSLRTMSGDPINLIEGAFTPVEDLVRLRNIKDYVDLELRRKTEIAVAENEIQQQTNAPAWSDIIPSDKQQIEYIGVPAGHQFDYTKDYLDKPYDRTVEKALPAGTTTVREALQHTPVVALDVNPYAELIKLLDKRISVHEGAIIGGYADPQDLPVIQKKLRLLKAQRLELLAKTEIVKKLAAQAKSYVATFQKVFNQDMRIVLTAITDQDKNGYFAYTPDVELTPGQRIGIGTLALNFDALATETYANKKMALNDATKMSRRKLFETINHELGHAFTVKTYREIYRKVSTGTIEEATEARELMIMLEQEYRRWLEAMSKGMQFDLLSTLMAPERAMDMTRPGLSQTPMPAEWPWKGGSKSYYLSFDEFFAEMTARLATQGSFADPVMTKFFTPVLQQYQAMFQHMPDWAKAEFGSDFATFMQSQRMAFKVAEELNKTISGGGKDIISVLRHSLPGYDPKNFAGLKEHLDKFDKLISWGFNLLQLAKENPHIPALQNYVKATAAWAEYQRNFQADANEVYKQWRSLGKVETSQLTDVLFDEALEKRRMDDVELSKRLTAEAQLVHKDIRAQLDRVLEEMRETALRDLRYTILENEELLNSEIEQVNEDFDKMKAQGYFPFIRFGKYTITARAKQELSYNGNIYKPGQLISFPSFETERERDEVLVQLRRELGDQATVASSIMRETDFVIQGMPRSILRSLRSKLEAAGDFTPDQAAAFERVAAEAAPFRNFRKHFLRKKGIHGYSEDALRSFAYYIRSAAGHIARVRFNDDLRASIDLIQQDVDVIKETGSRADERQEMRHWLDRHFSYIMNPGNELAALRGVGFVAYLGFNVKSALVNSLQIMTTVGPYLAARYGDGKAISEMTKATWTLKDWILKKKEYIAAMEAADKGKATTGQLKQAAMGKMIARGIHEGWLDQSLATELAIAASENNLDRGLYLPKARRFWHEFSRYSALPFHLVEKMNRYITAISAFNLEMQRTSNDFEKSVAVAREANWSTNYENARWNRPEFMRGKKSAFFLFGNYLQNTLYFATRDPGAVRYWLMMLLLAGFMGLPGAEDVVDLADFAGTYLSRILGLKNPKTQLRTQLREHLEDLGANPDLILHGLSQDSFGLGHVGELTGIPIPHLDLSRSVGMGDVLPLTEVPSMFLQAKPNDILVAAAASAAGASGNLVESYYRGLMSTNPDEWKSLERLLPMTAAKNLVKASRWALEGAEKTQGGQIIAQWDQDQLRDQLELLGAALGASPAKQVLGWEREIAVRDMLQYYKVQQEGLLRQLGWSWLQEDQEAKADSLAAIRKYNEQVPQPEMKIGSDTIRNSLENYLERQIMAEKGVQAERKYRRLRQQVEASYPDPYSKERNEPGFVP